MRAGAPGRPAQPPPGRGDWFSELFGFAETDYDTAKSWLEVDGNNGNKMTMTSLANGRVFQIGSFSTPSVQELAAQCAAGSRPEAVNGALRASMCYGDVKKLIANPAHKNATFQAASQFNCLEFISPYVIPEDGITKYEIDRTQGPACSIACGAATAYRNYFYPFPSGRIGQSEHEQINNLSGVLKLLRAHEAMLDDEEAALHVRNGYSFASDEALELFQAKLKTLPATEKPNLWREIRVGVHSDVEVTIPLVLHEGPGGGDATAEEGAGGAHTVTQVFASACSVAYSKNDPALWKDFSRLVLRGAYEATLFAALLNYIKCVERGGSVGGGNIVFITLLGGGVFGNSMEWIADAIERACSHPDLLSANLDVRINIFSRHPDNRRINQSIEKINAASRAHAQNRNTIGQ